MSVVRSADGTAIAYSRAGQGPALVLVDGAFCRRDFGPMTPLAEQLRDRFTVITYDRRGRGESGDAETYAVEREIEDLRALVELCDDPPSVYGTSSGAILAARAAAAGVPVRKLALYEPPMSLDGTRHPQPADFVAQIEALLDQGRRGDAAKLFLRVVGVPRPVVFIMALTPVFKRIVAAAPTLRYDFRILGDTQRGGPLPEELAQTLAAIRAPTLAMAGGASPPYLHHAAKVVGDHVGGEYRHLVVPRQGHNVSAKAIAPHLAEFFAA